MATFYVHLWLDGSDFESLKAGRNKDGNKDGLRVGPRDGKAGAGDAKCHRWKSLLSQGQDFKWPDQSPGSDHWA